jgi:hypothetical protein
VSVLPFFFVSILFLGVYGPELNSYHSHGLLLRRRALGLDYCPRPSLDSFHSYLPTGDPDRQCVFPSAWAGHELIPLLIEVGVVLLAFG